MEGDTHNDTRTDETDIVNRISSVFSKIGIILIIVSVVLVFFQRRPGKFWPNGVIKLAKVFQVVIQMGGKLEMSKQKPFWLKKQFSAGKEFL